MRILYEHGNELFILVLSPILGLILDYSITTKHNFWALGVVTVLISPILTEFEYSIPYAMQIIGLLFVSLIYSLYSKQSTNIPFKFLSAGILSILLLFILGHAAFMDSFGSQTDINYVWKKDGYKIEKKTNGGFSGRPSIEYSLKKYTWIPLFVREIEVINEVDVTKPCVIHFTHENVTLNRCDDTIWTPNK